MFKNSFKQDFGMNFIPSELDSSRMKFVEMMVERWTVMIRHVQCCRSSRLRPPLIVVVLLAQRKSEKKGVVDETIDFFPPFF